jgi:hypothetical protein
VNRTLVRNIDFPCDVRRADQLARFPFRLERILKKTFVMDIRS